MHAPVLELRDVSKRYGDFHAVQDVSFSLLPGMIYGFLGPNGAGKTTTIRMILDIIRPSSGTINILGETTALKVRNRIGYLPEEKGLYKKMKAWSVIAYFATLKGMSRSAAKARAFELLKRYGLGDFANAKTEALSKGMGQKVQVLASIAHEPEFVILDEPFSGLDPVNQEVMETIIRDMARRGTTVLFSTHVMQHAERLCERILLIAGGRKIFDGGIPEARRTLPQRLVVETDQGVEIPRLPGMATLEKSQQENRWRWEATLDEAGDPQGILQGWFAEGVRCRNISLQEPSLHEVFMHLVGPQAAEAKFR